ncbi:MAG TPA: DUF4173 domain-containing protein [Candidatus Deferrimicrobium sp.]|nr:DUF4173 domain-containing protein [Candidatus Deferrimicrobium sp.]
MKKIEIQQLESKEEWPVKKENIYFLICSVILGLLFNLLFFGKPLGLSYPLYVLALYTVLFWNMRQNQQVKFDWTWLLGIPIIALSCSYFIFSNQLFAALNFVMIPILFVAHTLLLTSNNRYKWFEFQFLFDILQGFCVRPLTNCLKPFSLISKISKPKAIPGKFRVVGKVLVGLLLTIPLLIVIVPLLASADDVFRNFVELIPNIFQTININEFVARVLIVTIVACLVFSYLWSLFVSKTALTGAVSNTNSLNKPGPFLDPITVTTILVLIDVLYIFFIAIQFSYLFGSLQSGLPDNFTYAQYARKGFFELVVVTLINLVILLGNMNFVKESGSLLGKVVKVLNTVLVVSTIIMLLSAHFRMYLYEEAYGFTYLRVLTHAFMVYLFVLFIVTLSKIWHQALPLLKSYIVISIVAYTLVNYINIDSLIAKNNIERYNKGNPIDIMYLTQLSYEAVPQLVDFMHSTSNQALAKQLENELKYKKQVLEKETPWQSFNISKYRARLAWFK